MKLNRRKLLLGAVLLGQWSCRARPRARTLRLELPPTPAASVVPKPSTPGPLHPERLARFVDALPVPPILHPLVLRTDPEYPSRQIPYFRLAMREIHARVHRDLPPTRFWAYGESVPGPTLELQRGQPALIEWANELPAEHFLPIDHTLCGADASVPDVRTVVHVHGARVPPESDGNPEE